MKNELAERFCWWWRQPNPIFEFGASAKDPNTTKPRGKVKVQLPAGQSVVLPASHLWKTGEERAAHGYELARRALKETLPPWPALDWLARAHIRKHLGRSDIPNVATAARAERPDGYSTAEHWDMRLPTETLLRGFKNYIEEQRRRFGIKPNKGNTGATRRPPSWRWIEELDKRRAGEPADKDVLRVAFQAAKRNALKLRELLPK